MPFQSHHTHGIDLLRVNSSIAIALGARLPFDHDLLARSCRSVYIKPTRSPVAVTPSPWYLPFIKREYIILALPEENIGKSIHDMFEGATNYSENCFRFFSLRATAYEGAAGAAALLRGRDSRLSETSSETRVASMFSGIAIKLIYLI
ncbi:hypothetical protein EVAR_77607_1 [Eumeta japonica]|uniref:Uncharacterized protein n=1 Tax=Eumeta variegata TaxID=151549 RepID=A0A4C1T9Q0_EUMVA|nr:hypothetical protein EVAR_77607_1 [Eumeta japonica]